MRVGLLVLWLFITFHCPLFSQQQLFTLTPEQVEQLFLEQNLELLAEKMNIPIADAAIAQAKLWDNPTLSVGDLNVWKKEESSQFSVELEQMIRTANKRGKLVRMEKVSREMAISRFEEVLRGMKVELRKTLYELEYIVAYMEVIDAEIASLTPLTEAYRKQVENGNLAKSEWVRLQSALFEVENERMETATELNALRKELNILLNLPPQTQLIIRPADWEWVNPEELILADLIYTAFESRPDLRLSALQTSWLEKNLTYEKAQRVPDLNLGITYDRYGGVWKDFVGLGVSIDLPVFNRNQGAIRAARIEIEQSRYEEQQQMNTAQNEIAEALNNYSLVYDFYSRIEANPLLGELDELLDSYTRNLLERNVSMLEYIDFMEAYKSNKQTLLSTLKNLGNQWEELRYSAGTDIK